MSPRVAIAAGHAATTRAGAAVAEAGGNAVDVAVGAAVAATVAEILMCSIGGSAAICIRRANGAVEIIEGADAVPLEGAETGAWREVRVPYGDGITIRAGHRSVAVPGMLAAAELAWQRHGRLAWRDVLRPAVELADAGFELGTPTGLWLGMTGETLFSHQDESRKCFFPGGQPARAGDHFVVPNLASSLEQIAERGARALYGGDLGRSLVREMADHGGLVSQADLESYRAEVRQPLRSQCQGLELALNPPPAVGGAYLGSLLALVQREHRATRTAAQRDGLHARVQARLLALREQGPGRDRLDRELAERLLCADYLVQWEAASRAPHTTHLSVATGDGEVVAISSSMGYGAGIVVPGTGIACNNTLGEPEMNPAGFGSLPPGARLVSNMAPTAAWHADGRRLALGSPGASRITTAIGQVLCRHALEGMSLEDAVAAPRLNVERIDGRLRLQYEPGIDTGEAGEAFVRRPFDEPHMFFGGVQLAGLDARGRLHAVADPRRGGLALVV